jgi:hypothetical protein
MVLLDTNILIYSVDPHYEQVREYLDTRPYAVSIITTIEALGYQAITPRQDAALREVIASGRLLELSSAVVDQAIRLKRMRKMKLGDAIIAGTALAADVELATRNEADFQGIPGLRIVNPVDKTRDAHP